MVGSSGHDETPETHTPVRALRVHTASVIAVECVFFLTLIHIYAGHGSDVEPISVVTVAGVTFLDADTAAIFTALDDATLL